MRTVISSVIPRFGTGHTFLLLITGFGPAKTLCLNTNISSYIFDYTARQKVGGTHLSYNYFKQLPVFIPNHYSASCPFDLSIDLKCWLIQRVLELLYTSFDMKSLSNDIGWQCNPFLWDESRRFMLRAELDAAFFYLYGIKREDVDYIMDTFLIVRKKDIKAHGSYRTKEIILEIYDRMKRAIDLKKPYKTVLDPPPADLKVTHPDRSG